RRQRRPPHRAARDTTATGDCPRGRSSLIASIASGCPPWVLSTERLSHSLGVAVAKRAIGADRSLNDDLREVSMTLFPGFIMPDELRRLGEQIRRFIREEVIPLEQRLDPDAPGIADEDFERLSSKTKAAGLWALGAPEEYGGGGLDTFSMCV